MPQKTVLVVAPDGTRRAETLPDDERGEAAALGRLVGGLPQHFRTVRPAVHAWVEDRSAVDGSPPNPAASAAVGRPVCGTVVLSGPLGPEGETLGLDAASLAELAAGA